MPLAHHYNDGNGIGSGHVRVYQLEGDNWVQLGKDLEGDASGAHFGTNIHLSNDGKTIVVRARQMKNDRIVSGQVKVYQYQSERWLQKGQTLYEGIEGIIDRKSGSDVKLNGVGDIIAINTPPCDRRSGRVSVYQYDNNQWTPLGNTIDKNEPQLRKREEEGYFVSYVGNSLDLNEQGDRLITSVGQEYKEMNEVGVYGIYELIGHKWQLQTSLENNQSTILGYQQPNMSADGNFVAIESKYYIRIYKLEEKKKWVQNEEDIHTALGENVVFGLADNGKSIVTVDYTTTDEENQMNIYQSENDQWKKMKRLIAIEFPGKFRYSLAMNSDGSKVVLGQSVMGKNKRTKGIVKVFETK